MTRRRWNSDSSSLEARLPQVHSSSRWKSVDYRCQGKGTFCPQNWCRSSPINKLSAQSHSLPSQSSHLLFRLLIKPPWTWEFPGNWGAASLGSGPDGAHPLADSFFWIFLLNHTWYRLLPLCVISGAPYWRRCPVSYLLPLFPRANNPLNNGKARIETWVSLVPKSVFSSQFCSVLGWNEGMGW